MGQGSIEGNARKMDIGTMKLVIIGGTDLVNHYRSVLLTPLEEQAQI
jgi:hypothetical protein